MKRICILGSTGSIGTQALQLVEQNKDRYQVTVLTCANQVPLLLEQIAKHSPEAVVVGSPEQAKDVQRHFPELTVLWGQQGLREVASSSWDMILNGLVGISGLAPTYYGIQAGNTIALANKETLVAGGSLIMNLAEEKNVPILPVDSEHSAIFQCLMGNAGENPRRLILTASGGPFRGRTWAELENVTLEDALCHPNWKMGKKITVDSATMMNKGLEIIEAHWLFHVDWDKIEVLVHPQSIVHSMVEYEDGSVMAQLGCPDMKIPIGLALSYPHRLPMEEQGLDFLRDAHSLSFEKADEEAFPCMALAKEAGRRGKSYPVVLNAANEVLVHRFLQGEISFVDIPNQLMSILERHEPFQPAGLEEILELDREVRNQI